jgi:hypothetical protein
MVRSIAVVGFIACVASFGLYLAQRRTVLEGSVMAADVVEQLAAEGVVGATARCDDRVPIVAGGARFHCVVHRKDDTVQDLEYTIDASGRMTNREIAVTHPHRR